MENLAGYDSDASENSQNTSKKTEPVERGSAARLEAEWDSFEKMIGDSTTETTEVPTPVPLPVPVPVPAPVPAPAGVPAPAPAQPLVAASSSSSSDDDDSDDSESAESETAEKSSKTKKKSKAKSSSESSDSSEEESSESDSSSSSEEDEDGKEDSGSSSSEDEDEEVEKKTVKAKSQSSIPKPIDVLPEPVKEGKQDNSAKVETKSTEKRASHEKAVIRSTEVKGRRSSERRSSHRSRSRSRSHDRRRRRSRSGSRSRRRRRSRSPRRHKSSRSRRSRSRSRDRNRNRKYSTSSATKSPDREKSSRSRGSRDRRRSRSRDRKHSSRDQHRRKRPRNRRRRSRSRDRRRRSRSRSRGRRSRSRSRSYSPDKRGGGGGGGGSSGSRSKHDYNKFGEKKPRSFKEQLKQQLMNVQKQAADGKLTLDFELQKKLMANAEQAKAVKSATNVHPLVAMAGSGEKVTPQQALLQTMAAMHQKAQELTGVAVPKYYNPAAVNPLKYAEQVQKRKLLWSKAKEKKEETEAVWGTTAFNQDNDGKVAAKFRKLMGIKPGEEGYEGPEEATTSTSAAPPGQAPHPKAVELLEKQKELFQHLDKEYENARITTHTHRGTGLGFASGVQPNFPKL